MDAEQRKTVHSKVLLEQHRAAGNLIGVLSTPAPIKERLRSAAYSNKWLYGLRRRLYGLLSGL
jgi:hypothetical protein